MIASKPKLPEGFSDLDPFVADWALPTMAARHRRRLASLPEEREAFYEAMVPRLSAAVEYLNRFPLDQMPPEAAALLQLALSLMEISLTQEVYDAQVEAVHARSSRLVRITSEMDGL